MLTSHADSLAPDDRAARAWVWLASLLLLGVIAGPFFLGRVPTADDLGAFHLPARQFFAECLARGDQFLWWPDLFCGFYLAGEGQAGMFHPAHWLLYAWLPLRAAINWELLIHYPLMAVGCYLFLQRHLAMKSAAWFGALVFTFSGFNLLHFVHPNAIAIVAHIPWLLWLMEVQAAAHQEGNARVTAWSAAAIALLTGSQLLLGYPQYVWFSLLAEGSLACWLWRRQAITIRVAGDWLLAKGLGAMLGAVQLLPTLEALQSSVRADVDAAFTTTGSLAPLNLVQWIAPYLFANRVVGQNTHELGCYFGAVPLMLCIWLISRRCTTHSRGLLIWSGAVSTVAMLLAWGKHGWLYAVQAWLPVVGSFRFPCRYLVLVNLALAVVTAVAFAELIHVRRERVVPAWRTFRPMFIGVLLSLIVMIAAGPLWGDEHLAGQFERLAGPWLLASAAWTLALAARGTPGAVAALVLLTAFDLGCYGASYAIYPRSQSLEQLVATAAMSAPRNDPPHGRVLMDVAQYGAAQGRTGNASVMAGQQRADGYAGLEPARRLDYADPAAQRAAGVQWVRKAPVEASSSTSEWQAIANTLPRAYCVTRVVVSHQPASDLSKIDLLTTALVDQPLMLPGAAAGTATVIVDRPGEVHVRTAGDQPQLLLVTESYHAGWRALIDGQPQTIQRVNGDFLGCLVPAGPHEVHFEFSPNSVRQGSLLSMAALLLLGSVTFVRVYQPSCSIESRFKSKVNES